MGSDKSYNMHKFPFVHLQSSSLQWLIYMSMIIYFIDYYIISDTTKYVQVYAHAG